MNFKNLKKTSIDNVYVLVEDVFNPIHGRTQEYTLYDFSQLQPMKVEQSTTKSGAKIDIIKHKGQEYILDDIVFKKYYKDIDPSFKRLHVYADRHTFESREYYYSKELKQIRISKNTTDRGHYYMNLTPSIINRKKAFTCVSDTGKSCMIFVDLICDHEQEEIEQKNQEQNSKNN